ncbi:hypothetical protein [Flavobacterium caeni]|uniref:Uncharacterized protein n=1 Tax=Flavobacterium caeni TaxID=490189 RepID=A0A1G5K7I5_9FLAO|nr:hypothetical protein [Flavobacterium caeni]SCY96211.1 hypothetical protein SAMN02927903_03110 [Flavobacterium caeni]
MNNYHNLFPNAARTIASYNTFSQVIDLNSFEQKDFIENLGKKPDNEQRIFNVSIFRHEIAHWNDHISTLWGHTRLCLLYNALNARANNELQEFWRIKMYGDVCKQDTLFEYFTELHHAVNGSFHERWKAFVTAGLRFQANGYTNAEKPILFVSFRSNADVPIARVPISIASILETIATLEEYKIKFQSLGFVEDIVERKRLEKLFNTDLEKLIYNSKLTLYNVVSHLTANVMKASDIIWALETASAIGTIVLNLPISEMEKMKLAEFGSDDIDSRAAAFQQSCDKGYVFYNLLLNLLTSKGERTYNVIDLLSSSNLSSEKNIEEQVVLSMEQNIKNLIPGPFYSRAKKLMEFGLEIFKLRGIDGRKEGFDFTPENFTTMPHIMFGDTVYDDDAFNLGATMKKLERGEEISLAEEYFLFEYFQKKLDEFISICGI